MADPIIWAGFSRMHMGVCIPSTQVADCLVLRETNSYKEVVFMIKSITHMPIESPVRRCHCIGYVLIRGVVERVPF